MSDLEFNVCNDDFIDIEAGINMNEFIRLFTCPLCCNIMKVPVKVLWPCCTTKKEGGCKAIACLRCVRNMLGLNEGQCKKVEEVKCFICRISVFKFDRLGAHCYSKEPQLMAVLDCLVNKRFVCDGNHNHKWCNKEFTSQFDLDRHIKGNGTNPCGFSYALCPYFNNGCNTVLMRYEIKDHERKCAYAKYKCDICYGLIKSSDMEEHLLRHNKILNDDMERLLKSQEKVKLLLESVNNS